jgi:dynein light chain Tctex-type 1
VDAICDKCMADLHELNKPFKYVVTAAVVQKNGAGVHAGHSAYWDSTNDNLCQVSWPTDKMREQQGSRMRCIVTAFGLSL